MSNTRILQEIANTISITVQCIPSNSLLTGRMGVTIFLYQYARYSNNSQYEALAESLLDKIYSQVNDDASMFFAEGLPGIGWGLNYLVQEQYVVAESDLFDDIDDAVREITTKQFLEDLDEKIPLFSKGLYFTARGLKEDLSNTLYELETFLPSVPIETLPHIYKNSIVFFLTQLIKIGHVDDQERCRLLLKKFPNHKNTYLNWENLIYCKKRQTITDGEEEIICLETNEIIKNIHYQALGLHKGLAGFGTLFYIK
ncbi:hypothetical protein M2451_003466 [Dysgonomonas sp. PFB1-18]|uniref:lanthionine synthetase LanC family protein n=1 Tax=unclassified Dysgonomonas TaxID=2630389 RepID=UPI00247558BA|nr:MULTISPECIES: lanthionine synthetase LanC family protein [unclassified Dysgonomonas]MDH6310615.1 hypothetical protein [Dysgonomonas sp. PF1-14]MDH6340466.1 hypothetical protein [Dysgonomonas sp. PF1-16]MDH6382126.1 hypothetical protein [Dysgonomonas sp. PFB1-18]MDH6399470.1 hypothetical protein [Dysgonomonas sp. PF1-23]